MANEFPDIWFDTFLSSDSAAPVDAELRFIQQHFPLPDFGHLVDVPCGIGRHAGPLAGLGYRVVGIDRSERAITQARARYPSVSFRAMDMFDLAAMGETFDGLLCLWHSFGYGTSEENLELLANMRDVVRPGGRLLFDLYNADAAARLPSSEQAVRGGRTVSTRRSWSGRRLRVELEYSDSDVRDVHEWEIYGPQEFQSMAAHVGLSVIATCAWFDRSIPPSAEHLRMQILLERTG